MGKIILIIMNFVFGIILVASSFSGIQFWKGIDEDGLKEYYNSMSDKDIAFSMGYVVYRNYMEQLKILKVNTNGLITKVDYSKLKTRLQGQGGLKENIKSNSLNKIKINKTEEKKDVKKPKKRFKLPGSK